MNRELEEKQSVENRNDEDSNKIEESIEKEKELDELGSFMEMGEDSKESDVSGIEHTGSSEEVVFSDRTITSRENQRVEESLQIQENEIEKHTKDALLQTEVNILEENKSIEIKSIETQKQLSTEEAETPHLEKDSLEEDEKAGFLERRKQKREKKLFERQRKLYIFSRARTNWLSFVPFILLIVCLPWISYVKSPNSILKWFAEWKGATPLDYILYQKSIWLLIIIHLCLLFGLFYHRKMERKKDIILGLAFLCLTLYAILMIISAVMSDYTEISLWGAEEQREGLFVLISYVVLCITGVSLYRKEKDYMMIFGTLSVLVVILILFLVADTMEYHFYDAALLQRWKQVSTFDSVSPELLQSMGLYALTLTYAELGTLCSLLLPFFTVMSIFTKRKTMRAVSIIMAICSCVLLFFSTSRAGLLGVAIAFFVLLVTSVRKWVIHYKQTLSVIAILSLFCAGVSIATEGEIFLKGNELKQDLYGLFKNQENFDYHRAVPIKDISVEGKRLFFTTQQEVLEVDYTTNAINCFDKAGQFVEFKKEDGVCYTTNDSRFVDFSFETEIIKTVVKGKEEKRKILRLYYQNEDIFIVNLAGLPEKAFLDEQYKNLDIVEASYFGFEGKEKSANNRGYVWSRTIPLLKHNVCIGSGAGTFTKVFPQGDVLAKWYVYGTPNETVNQTNNWYLQMGVEQGLFALFLLIVVLSFYFVDSFVLYLFRQEYNPTEIFGFAIFVALVGYSVNTMFVSTSVSVAPLFWCLFGFGMAANHWVRRMREQEDVKMSSL